MYVPAHLHERMKHEVLRASQLCPLPTPADAPLRQRARHFACLLRAAAQAPHRQQTPLVSAAAALRRRWLQLRRLRPDVTVRPQLAAAPRQQMGSTGLERRQMQQALDVEVRPAQAYELIAQILQASCLCLRSMS